MLEFRASYASSPQSVATARNALVSLYRVAGFDSDLLNDIELAVGEALANVAEHAAHQGATRFEVRSSVDGDALVIEIEDNGRGFDFDRSRRPRMPGPEILRGYGTSIMHAVMDLVEYRDGGTCVRLVKRLPGADAEFQNRLRSN